MRMRCFALLFCLLLPLSVAAQEDPHAACTQPPAYIPAELLERPVALRTGFGNSAEKVSTTIEQAQAFYNQGLNYLESFVWIEAARSFHQALRLDPNLAMAYIGLSRVYSGIDDVAAAKGFLKKAQELGAGASESERSRIELRRLQLEAMDNLEDVGKHLAYKKAIDGALAADMSNPPLWLLRGNAEEPSAAGRGQRGGAASIAFYEMVLQIEPENATAHHYLVHSYETIGRADKALQHGEQYARLSPSVPHAAHMWGHDLRRVGRIDDAIAEFLKTNELERAYFAAEKIQPSMDWHHGHNLDLLATCYQHSGKMALAEKTLREAEALVTMDAYRAFARREVPNFLLHRGRYSEALEAARQLAALNYPQSRAVGHALAGQALLALGKPEDAEKELQVAEQEIERVPRLTPGVLPNRGAVEPWLVALRGELLLRNGNKEKGRELLQQVQRTMRNTPGADAWTQTLFRLEMIARNARSIGEWELAEYTAKQMLEHDAAYGGSHLAMALVAEHAGNKPLAIRAMEDARKFWSNADPNLPELQQIQQFLGKSTVTSSEPSGLNSSNNPKP